MSRAPRRVVATALGAATVGALPSFLAGALALQIRAELGFSAAQLGAAISAFFLASTITSAAAGRQVDRFGWHRSIVVALFGSATVIIAVATLVQSWSGLAGALALGGVFHSIAMPAGNVALVQELDRRRHAFNFGIKQAAMPVAGLLAGLSVPTLALTVGWRWAFASGAVVAVAVLLLMPSAEHVAARTRAPGGTDRQRVRHVRSLLLITAGGAFAAMVVGVLGAFFVSSAVSTGLSEGTAGVLLAVGSGLGVTTRLVLGWLVGRQGGHPYGMVALLVALGGAGCFAFAAGTIPLLGIGIAFAFAGGWGWSGLLHFAVVRLNPDAPAAATGIVLTGLSGGSMAGPLLFGLLVERAALSTAWTVLGLLSLGGAGLIVWGSQHVRHGAARSSAVSTPGTVAR